MVRTSVYNWRVNKSPITWLIQLKMHRHEIPINIKEFEHIETNKIEFYHIAIYHF